MHHHTPREPINWQYKRYGGSSFSQNQAHPNCCTMATSIQSLLTKDRIIIEQLRTLKTTLTKGQIRAADCNHCKEMKQKTCKRQQRLLSKQRKRTHAEIFGDTNSQRSGLQALKDPCKSSSSRAIEMDSANAASIITQHTISMLSAVSPHKGTYLPTGAPRTVLPA